METREVKAGLDKFRKDELIKTFPSLELKPADKKTFLVEAILSGEPLEEEKEAFKELLAEKIKEEPEKNDAPVYIVVHPIKENGVLYEVGDEYKGKFVDRFLGDQVRKKD
jgi:hypothetical protein